MKSQRKKFSELYTSRVVLVVLTIFLFFVINATVKIYDKQSSASVYVEKAEEDMEDLIEREKELTKELLNLETEEGIEREVRETFGFVKEGEKVLVIVDEETEMEQVLPKPPSLWQRFMSVFK